ncbi:MFS transporter [Candidatus Synchoanobacter obligatus]|uniref:MFS transporter n=1 Tax=Candidatus Synchoanobacter obligatus TaxID=2919597 RepID=A0ABT1L4Y4_9GAMM|nr:MFS transporter [Candidatus Synchoanobacter obligatus]MCP8351976.1 MFS transporter [Candidatus Synchoanobacter obligatus]
MVLRSWRKKLLPYINWGIAVSCFLVQLTIQVSSGMLASQLSQEFSLDAVSVAVLMGMVFYPNICFQIPAGIVTDRFGARKVLSVGAVVCSIGAYGFSHADSFFSACVFRLIMGSGLSFAFVSMAYLIANWMRKDDFSKMFCIAEMIALSFTVGVMRYLAVALQEISWRLFIQGICYAAMVLAVLAFVCIRDRPDYLEDQQPFISLGDLLVQLKGFLKDHMMWANGIYSGLLFSCLSCFVAQWGPNFLSNATTMSFEDAAGMCTFITMGLVVACPLLSLAIPKVVHIRSVMSLSALVTSILLSLVVMFPMMDLFMMRCCLFLTGFFSAAYLIPFTIAHYYVRPGSKSTSIGFTNMLSTIFGPLLSLLIAWLIDFQHDADLLSSYSLYDYQYGLNILPMSMFFAAMAAFFVPIAHRPGLERDL